MNHLMSPVIFICHVWTSQVHVLLKNFGKNMGIFCLTHQFEGRQPSLWLRLTSFHTKNR